jgi:putative oxidoreductase
VTDGGWEYPAVIIATVALIAEMGPGPVSLDAARGSDQRGTGWALAALAGGAAASAALLRDWERPPQQSA